MTTTSFTSKAHKSAWKVCADFLKEGILTDLTVRGNDSDEEFKVHKLILCISSPFFRAFILNDDITHISIHFMTSEVLKLILDYIYKGVAEVKTNITSKFVEAASLLELEGFLSPNPERQNVTNTLNKERNLLSNNDAPIVIESDEEPNVENNNSASPTESDDDVIFVDSPGIENVLSNQSSSKQTENFDSDEELIIVDDVQLPEISPQNNIKRKLETENGGNDETKIPSKRPCEERNEIRLENGGIKKCVKKDEKVPRKNSQKAGTSNSFYLNGGKVENRSSVVESQNRPFFLQRVLFPNSRLKKFDAIV